jgi:hypothetical protein
MRERPMALRPDLDKSRQPAKDLGMNPASMLWQRLDAPGHDACLLKANGDGWQLEGTAVLLYEGQPARLTYNIICDARWRTQQGEVSGWVGGQPIAFSIIRAADGVWTCNGAVVPGLEACVDLDLGFSPATNLLQLRRLALSEGQAAEAPVAWLDVSAGTLDLLGQRYERRTQFTYWYEAPRFNYAALLEVNPTGFVCRYPDLWQAV